MRMILVENVVKHIPKWFIRFACKTETVHKKLPTLSGLPLAILFEDVTSTRTEWMYQKSDSRYIQKAPDSNFVRILAIFKCFLVFIALEECCVSSTTC